ELLTLPSCRSQGSRGSSPWANTVPSARGASGHHWDMPNVNANGIDIYYEVQGEGEPLILIPYLGEADAAGRCVLAAVECSARARRFGRARVHHRADVDHVRQARHGHVDTVRRAAVLRNQKF